MGFALLGQALPTFFLGVMLIYIFAGRLGWLPSFGQGDGSLNSTLKHLVLPTITLATFSLARNARLVRSSLLEVMGQDYIKTARAKGLPEWRVVIKHALQPSILPLVSYFGPACAGVVTGSLIVERIFRLPGLGQQFYTAALQRDYTLVMAVVILYATTLLVLNLVGDILHALLDPKVRLS